ncbi:helix-turn-helix transcriptional regulator [Gilvimarinus sp. SDUM040013]|uniref:Helix-turn-helix transcriptional regulator n=1 Tax=Gilvimarinus gilvus TaxID=3058038 RepID=A0ABU4S4E5_9GAMM|nr:helix-turn-helix transcriptional regulator [Gilvimarinus sp. SDUM040013]MDO3387195.1 helix-turn-helix transcriptional regulator [Gilvimarinus sp. SDUM040013]MDX6850758.1 helix-turn-helix transcriptional regulator [Gilvimarinus sp. SDUM040013]
MVTGIQVRMARAGLRWNAKDLSDKSGVGLSTVNKIDRADGLPSVRIENLQAVRDALLNTGRVTFEGEHGVTVKPE